MPNYEFSADELAALSAIADRLASGGQTDADTSNMVEKLHGGDGSVELSDVERASLKSVLDMALAMAEATGEAEFDLDALKSAGEKLG